MMMMIMIIIIIIIIMSTTIIAVIITITIMLMMKTWLFVKCYQRTRLVMFNHILHTTVNFALFQGLVNYKQFLHKFQSRGNSSVFTKCMLRDSDRYLWPLISFFLPFSC